MNVFINKPSKGFNLLTNIGEYLKMEQFCHKFNVPLQKLICCKLNLPQSPEIV